MTDLSELTRRVGAATGPDREIDAAIWATLQGVRLISFSVSPGGLERIAYDGALRWPEWIGQPKLTASLDQALFLVERCLPGNYIKTEVGPGGSAAEILNGNEDELGWSGWRANWPPALSLCLAILKALEAK